MESRSVAHVRGWLPWLGLVLALPGLASANGGPVDWPAGTAHGGVVPRQETQIRLVSEDLEIVLGDDLDHYEVEARYTLENPGPAREVTFGVPIEWTTRRSARDVAAGISIELAGARRPCAAVGLEKRTELRRGVDSEALANGAWCVATLSFPPAARSIVTLRCDAELEYVDYIFSKSALKAFDDRLVRYQLSPAGYWQGSVEHLRIRVDPGRFSERTKALAPAGWKRADHELRWDLTDVDLKTIGDLEIRLDLRDFKEHEQLAHWNVRSEPYARLPIEASASSTLVEEGGRTHRAEAMTDGDPRTAWCEGVPGDGRGEWIELRVAERDMPPNACTLEGLAIVPGYAKSQTVYRANGRVSALSIDRCNRSEEQEPARLDVGEDFDRSARKIPLSGSYDSGQGFCVHLEIRDVLPGTRHRDTCISELAVILHCG